MKKILLNTQEKIEHYCISISYVNFLGKMEVTATINTLFLRKTLGHLKLKHIATKDNIDSAVDAVIEAFILDEGESFSLENLTEHAIQKNKEYSDKILANISKTHGIDDSIIEEQLERIKDK